MSGKAAKIQLTDVMYMTLQDLANSRSVATSVVQRANVIRLAAEKHGNQAISSLIGLSAKTVGLWRQRWRQSYPALLRMQFTENKARFKRSIVLVLSDAPRSGSPGKFTAEQVTGLICIACEPPENSGRPVTTWTGRELADECQQRGLVDAISASHVNRILREVDLKPHQSCYWCNTTEKDPDLFQAEMEIVCQTYLQAPELYHQCNTHTVCVDEMTSLQANQRRAKTKPPLPGQIAKEEFQYTRHGTICVTGNWNVVAGQMIATTIAETRNNEDFAKHIRQTVASDPEAGWVFVVDNLNTHCGEPLARAVADLLGIEESELGVKKKRGILKTMASRRDFLSDRSHRIRFVYLPKHSSWLNQIEIIFGVINRRVMRGGSFTSKADLQGKLTKFIDYFNETFAKPMNWTYTGRPTRSTPDERPRTWREARQPRTLGQKLAVVGRNL